MNTFLKETRMLRNETIPRPLFLSKQWTCAFSATFAHSPKPATVRRLCAGQLPYQAWSRLGPVRIGPRSRWFRHQIWHILRSGDSMCLLLASNYPFRACILIPIWSGWVWQCFVNWTKFIYLPDFLLVSELFFFSFLFLSVSFTAHSLIYSFVYLKQKHSPLSLIPLNLSFGQVNILRESSLRIKKFNYFNQLWVCFSVFIPYRLFFHSFAHLAHLISFLHIPRINYISLFGQRER